MTADLPRAVRVLARLIPAADREWVLGDLVEDLGDRGVRGAERGWWLAVQCAAIGVGLSAQRASGWFELPALRELVAGLAVDGRAALRSGSVATVIRALLFCGSVATLAIGVEILIRSLFAAAGF